jgi:hypothetical protein
MYTDNSIIIIRRRGERIQREDITTANVLMDSGLSAEQNRKNTIERLRQDPTVIFILEPRDGRCEEKAVIRVGYELAVTITDGEKREATLAIRQGGETLYEAGYEWNPDEIDYDYLEDLTEDMIDFLTGLEEDQEWLYSRGYIKTRTDTPQKERLTLFDAEEAIQDAGYQSEHIDVPVGYSPLLFVVENEVVLLGARHFGENDLFVEVKRLRWSDDKSELETVRRYCDEYDGVELVEWEDGSLGFRSSLSTWTRKGEFMDEVLSRLGIIEDLLTKIEEREEYPGVTPRGITMWRQHFIYEAFDASLKLANVKF